MQTSARFTQEDLHRLGLAVVGDEAVRITSDTPDSSWALDQLAGYAKAQLDISSTAEAESVLHAHKSAVALYWAGCALFFAREQCKAEGHGQWADFKRQHGLADTTVNDAIRLYENAKTPEALNGISITEAKVRFVYPAVAPVTPTDDETDIEEPAPGQGRLRRQDRHTPAGRNGQVSTTAKTPPPKEPDTLMGRLVKLIRWLEYQASNMEQIDWRKESPSDCLAAIQQAETALHGLRQRVPAEGSDA